MEVPQWLISVPERIDTSIIEIETKKQLDNLYKTLSSAYFNLAMSCYPDYSSFVETKENLFIREQFAKSAIMWYNATFDILLQSIWLYYKIFYKVLPNAKLTSKGINDILGVCHYVDFLDACKNNEINIDKELYDGIVSLRNYINPIANWTNILKHRGNFEFQECPFRLSIPKIFTNWKIVDRKLIIYKQPVTYDSSTSIRKASIYSAIRRLIIYHQKIVNFSKILVEKLHIKTYMVAFLIL